jgi:hypothetical protein
MKDTFIHFKRFFHAERQMPTPDASAYTQMKRYSSTQSKSTDNANAVKPLTHLYQPNVRASNLTNNDYLPTLFGKPTTVRTGALPWKPIVNKNTVYIPQKYIK